MTNYIIQVLISLTIRRHQICINYFMLITLHYNSLQLDRDKNKIILLISGATELPLSSYCLLLSITFILSEDLFVIFFIIYTINQPQTQQIKIMQFYFSPLVPLKWKFNNTSPYMLNFRISHKASIKVLARTIF